MPDIRILLFIGFVLFQIIRFFAKNSAEKKAKTPQATPSTIEEMIEKMNQQQQQKPKPQNTGQISQKKRVPIIASEVVEENLEKNPNKYVKQKVLINQSINMEDYEVTSPVFLKEDRAPFDEFAAKTETNIYLEKMKNPQSFREAFVINEILNPKYI
jgi:hypothetical protein